MKNDDTSPSAARRRALRESAKSKTSLVPTVPLKDYYALTDRLYASFCVALDDRQLDNAYVWGIRFATFSTEALPQHPAYYGKQPALQKLRKRNAQRTQQVLNQLEAVTARMDAEEQLKEQQRQRRAQEQEEERRRLLAVQQKEEQEAREEEKRLELVKKQHHEAEKIRLEQSKIARQQAVQHSALAKLASLRHQRRPEQQSVSSEPAPATANANAASSSNEGVDANKAHAKLAALGNNSHQDITASKERPDPSTSCTSNGNSQQQQQQKEDDVTNDYNPSKDLSDEEKRTLALLQQTIARQEARIQDIVRTKIPAWRSQAKAKLVAGQRKEALHCVYHKRRWERTIDILKESIFQMETQILRIQSAAHDREVASVLQAATDAMQAIQQDHDDAMGVMSEIEQGGLLSLSDDQLTYDNVDEDELLNELLSEESADESATAAGNSKALTDMASLLPKDVLDLLALPSSSAEHDATTQEASAKKESPGLLKAILG